jgi:hypothetical protein
MMNRFTLKINKLLLGLLLYLFVFMRISFANGISQSKELVVPRRISGQIIDLGKVQPIYMVAGMATIIEIPDAVTGIRVGNPDTLRYFQPKKPENEVTLVLQDSHSKPTNLIIR